jgi:phenylpropionate dioxygenase-like ring-hydroxylating dioxygenase large terminal subunit
MTNPDLKVVADSDPVMGLDARYFTDRELYRRIVDQVFYKNWLLACHSSQVGKPGDYLTLEIYDQDILVTHDRDGAIRAFYNVCQHRGHKLASGSGNKKLLVCPYHAWSYDLRGQLNKSGTACQQGARFRFVQNLPDRNQAGKLSRIPVHQSRSGRCRHGPDLPGYP